MNTTSVTPREQSDTFESVPAGGMFSLDGLVYIKSEDGKGVETSIGKIIEPHPTEQVWPVVTVTLDE